MANGVKMATLAAQPFVNEKGPPVSRSSRR